MEYRFQPDGFEVLHLRATGLIDVDLDQLLGKTSKSRNFEKPILRKARACSDLVLALPARKPISPWDKGFAMPRRTLVLLAASVIAGVALTASVSTDASAARKHARAVAARPGAAVVVTADYGPPADRVPRCFDSPILYPVPPCY